MGEQSMFCYQCEQTAKGEGCTRVGVCGKEPEVAILQDLLIYALKGLSQYAVEGRRIGIKNRDVNLFTCEALFSTLTNVNFDPSYFVRLIHRCVELREDLKKKVQSAGGQVSFTEGPAIFKPEGSLEGLIAQGGKVGLKSDPSINPDILSLQHTLLFGMKGVAAYADHALILGKEDDAVFAFLHEGLATMLRKDLSLDDWIKLVLKCGEINLRTMELLDSGNTETYGHPVPTKVSLGSKKGKAILVSGHDLKDLEELLKQSDGKGIYVYTHGEMLPAHGYPRLKKYSHFYGHYGTAWQNQTREFEKFPGAILMTTNCIQRPKETYKDTLFTSGVVGWQGTKHISDRNFASVIEKALTLPGFPSDTNGRSVMVGFAHHTTLGVADKVIEAVKGKAIRHFFLVAGCDGAKPGRNYYTEFVEKVPKGHCGLNPCLRKVSLFRQGSGRDWRDPSAVGHGPMQ